MPGLRVEPIQYDTDIEVVDGKEALVYSGKIRVTVTGADGSNAKLTMAASHAASGDREATVLSWGAAVPEEYAASFYREGDEIKVLTPFDRILGADSETWEPEYRHSWIRDGAFAVLTLAKRQGEVVELPFDERGFSKNDVLMLGFQVATALAAWWLIKRAAE